MRIQYSKSFIRSYKSRIRPNKKLLAQFEERVALFAKDPSNPVLRDHKLIGKLRSYRAFSVSGDVRVVYFASEKRGGPDVTSGDTELAPWMKAKVLAKLAT